MLNVILFLALAGDSKGQAPQPPAKAQAPAKGQAAVAPKVITQSAPVQAEIVREGKIRWRKPRLVIRQDCQNCQP